MPPLIEVGHLEPFGLTAARPLAGSFGTQVMGTPSAQQVRSMNPNYNEFKFPQIKPQPWSKVVRCPSRAAPASAGACRP